MKAFAAAFVVVLTLTASGRAAADLAGRVVFSGLPVPGVTVTATMGAQKAATVTDEGGAFRFSNLGDGTWTLRTEMRGFASDVRDVVVPPSASPLIVALKMQSYAAIAATPAAEVPPAVEPPPDAPDILNGSVVNGAASIFAQPRAFGNNRPSEGPRYTGAVTSVLGNSAWNAAPYSFGPSPPPPPSYDDLQLGFTLAGPLRIPGLVRNGPLTRITYQHAVSHNAVSQSALMPTAAERTGDFSQSATIIRDPRTGEPFPDNVIPPDRISPQAAALVGYYPLPTGLTQGGANYEAPILTGSTSDVVQAGLNQPLNRNRTQLAVSFNYQRTVADTVSLFGFTDRTDLSSLNATVTLAHRFSQRMSMRATYRVARSATEVTPFFAGRVNVSGDAGIIGNNQDPENWGPPVLAFPAIADLRDADHQRNIAVMHTAGGEATWRRGRHAITFGGDVRRNAVDVSSQPDPRGTLAFTGRATGDALADFLLGLPATSAIAFGTSVAELRQPTYDAYVSDDFRAGAGLTLTLGLRWEYEAPFTERSGQLVNLAVAPGFTAVTPVIGESLLRPDQRGLEPRLAVSWRPVAGSSLVVRGSYGVYRSLGVYEPLARLLAQQPPFSRSFSVQNSLEAPLTLANPFPESIPAASTFAVDPDFRAAFAHTWQAVVQRDVPGSLTVIASYDGSRGTHLMQAFLPNTYPAGAVNPCQSCPAGFVYVTSGGESLRNALQLILRRRLHNGLTASVQYTLSKSMDNAATFTGRTIAPGSLGIAQDWLDLDAEHGPSSFDRRHQVAVQFQYTTGVGVAGGTLVDGVRGALFKDWTIAGQLSTGSGLPVTPVSFITVTGTGTVGVRPDLTGESTAPTSAGSYANPAAFTAPASGTWGNAGRNSIRGPAQFALDASVSRVFRLGGRVSLEWRVTATNVLNRVTFSGINTVVTSPQFGFPTHANPMCQLNTTFRLRF
jgi:hypothetical protein